MYLFFYCGFQYIFFDHANMIHLFYHLHTYFFLCNSIIFSLIRLVHEDEPHAATSSFFYGKTFFLQSFVDPDRFFYNRLVHRFIIKPAGLNGSKWHKCISGILLEPCCLRLQFTVQLVEPAGLVRF